MAINAFRRPEAIEPTFEVRSEGTNGLARVLLFGELDLAAVPLLEQECGRVEERGGRVVALDLSGLTFIDAAGLRAVVSAEARARKKGRALPLVGASAALRRIFDLTGTGGLLDVGASRLP